jgi:hypothetical protein
VTYERFDEVILTTPAASAELEYGHAVGARDRRGSAAAEIVGQKLRHVATNHARDQAPQWAP